MTYTDRAITALERALSRKVWSDPITVMDVQEALDNLYRERTSMCQMCRWEAGFGARKPVGGHTHPEPDIVPGSEEALIRREGNALGCPCGGALNHKWGCYATGNG